MGEWLKRQWTWGRWTEGDNRRHRVLDYLAWILLMSSILLLQAFSFWLENIYHGSRFVASYGATGFLLAGTWMYLLYKWEPRYFQGGEVRASAVLAQFFSLIFLTLFAAAYHTRETGKASPRSLRAVVLNRTENKWASTPYVTLALEGRRERFRPDWEAFRRIKVGDTLILHLGKGTNGYEAVYRFEGLKP